MTMVIISFRIPLHKRSAWERFLSKEELKYINDNGEQATMELKGDIYRVLKIINAAGIVHLVMEDMLIKFVHSRSLDA